jgi:serine protease Do
MNRIKLPFAPRYFSLLLALAFSAAPVASSAAPATATVLAASSATAAAFSDFTELVDKVGPAVVHIRTVGSVAQDDEDDEDGDDDGQTDQDAQMREFLRRFFGMPDGGTGVQPPAANDQNAPQDIEPQGDDSAAIGSGFIISQDGYVMTNAHVVDGAKEIYIKMTDGREFQAKLVGVDSRSDIAVLKVDASNLPTVAIGNSSKAKVGEWVIAIGSPFDLENSVTAGIISAKGRETGDFLPFIQTDVAVNPGNSGGPLINLRGEVVGINSQIFSQSGGFMGISFAIPIDDAMHVAEELKTSGHVTRGLLGVYLGDVDKDVAKSLGLSNMNAALVGKLAEDSPADKAGIKNGDIILKFNDTDVDGSAPLRRAIASTAPGKSIKLQIWRGGKIKDVSVVLGVLPSETLAQVEPPPQIIDNAQAQNAYGISIGELSLSQKKGLKLSRGVLVNDVDGPAERAGLHAGDILLTMNDQDIKNGRHFTELLAKADPKKPLLLLAQRGDSAQFFVVHPPTLKQ